MRCSLTDDEGREGKRTALRQHRILMPRNGVSHPNCQCQAICSNWRVYKPILEADFGFGMKICSSVFGRRRCRIGSGRLCKLAGLATAEIGMSEEHETDSVL